MIPTLLQIMKQIHLTLYGNIEYLTKVIGVHNLKNRLFIHTVQGIIQFVKIAHESFKDNPTPYYPTPMLGPILLATLLGNMRGFVQEGLHGYIKNGMPYKFQNGLFCATFYHVVVNDSGFIGEYFRMVINLFPSMKLGLNNEKFAAVFVSFFMHVVGVLQMPDFLGPNFSPFQKFGSLFSKVPSGITKPLTKENVKKKKES